MRSGETLQVTFSDPTGAKYDFKVYVAAVTATELEFRWAFPLADGTEWVASVWVDKATRAMRLAPSFKDFLFVTGADIDAGSTTIGGETATLTTKSLTDVVFTTSRADYSYDAATGLLRKAQDRLLGSALTIPSRSLSLSVPPASTEMPRVTDLNVEQEEFVMASSDDSVTVSSTHLDRAVLECKTKFAGWFGGIGKLCDADFYAYGDGEWRHPGGSGAWDFLGYGLMDWTYKDSAGSFHLVSCVVPTKPHAKDNQGTCPSEVLRTPPSLGNHHFDIDATIYGCLNPVSTDEGGQISPFTCKFKMNPALVAGQLKCLLPTPSCTLTHDA